MTEKDFSNLGGFDRAMQQMQEAQEEPIEQEEQETQEKQRKPRKRYTQEEAQALLEEGRNARGLGGVKAKRINMAFTPANHDFLTVLSRMSGMTITDFANKIIDKARTEYKDLYDEAQKLKKQF